MGPDYIRVLLQKIQMGKRNFLMDQLERHLLEELKTDSF